MVVYFDTTQVSFDVQDHWLKFSHRRQTRAQQLLLCRPWLQSRPELETTTKDDSRPKVF